ncbi:MAG: PD40 domain-containing protein [Acidobacteria bacterium]|nr:PD40 domain-containing protein [Acidobacteriota bacterium]
MERLSAAQFRFGEFELDGERRTLTHAGREIPMKAKAFDLLCYLVENRGKQLTKSEILDGVWPGQFVEENNLSVQISALRKILGTQNGGGQFVVTIPGKGYAFVAKVEERGVEHNELIIETHSRSQVVIEEEIVSSSYEGAAERTQLPSRKRIGSSTRTRAVLVGVVALLFTGAAYFYFGTPQQSEAGGSLELTKVTSTGRITNVAGSADGVYAVFSQTEPGGESLWLHHLATGAQQRIMPPTETRFVGLAVTPDNNFIYATTFSANIADPKLLRMPILGGPIEEIKGITTGASVSFSPDGRQMAFTRSRSSEKQTQLLIADADGSNMRVLLGADYGKRSFANFSASPVAWSPDGTTIAAAINEHDEAGGSRIILVDPREGDEISVADHRWDIIENLTWTNAENIAFIAHSIEPSASQIWTIAVRTGAATQVTNDLNAYNWLASSGGKLLAVQKRPTSTVEIFEIDEKAKRGTGREILRESGLIELVDFGPEGEVLYLSHASGRRELWQIEADGSGQQQLTVNANPTFGMAVSPVDGSIVFAATEDGKHFLKIADKGGKNLRKLSEGPEDMFPSFSPDGRSVVFQRGLRSLPLVAERIDLNDGSRTPVGESYAARPRVSPDGSTIAYYFIDTETDGRWKIGLMSSDEGKFLGKLTIPRTIEERQLRWHPSGNSIGQIVYDGDDVGLLLIPINGGEAVQIAGLGSGRTNSFNWSKDGKRIVISNTQHSQDVVRISY